MLIAFSVIVCALVFLAALPVRLGVLKLPDHPLDISRMTAAQLDAELEKGLADVRAGRTIPAEQAFAEIRKEFGL